MWSRMLTAPEIAAAMTCAPTADLTGVIAYVGFNEPYGAPSSAVYSHNCSLAEHDTCPRQGLALAPSLPASLQLNFSTLRRKHWHLSVCAYTVMQRGLCELRKWTSAGVRWLWSQGARQQEHDDA